MSYQTIEYQRRGNAVWLWLNRPDALNALSPEVMAELLQALARAEAEDGIRALVLSGRGRAFCAGADLKHFLAALAGDKGVRGFVETALNLMNRVEAFPYPTIAAVNGIAVAGGIELVLACDLVIAADSAVLGDAHMNYGLLPGGGSSIRLPRKLGPTRAKYLLFTGDSVPAAEALALGLVNKVVPAAELEAAVEKLVGRLAEKSPVGLRRMKRLVDDGLETALDAALRLEMIAWEAHAHAEDLKEGLAAFSAKRKPVYRDR
jgi:enoyl-CoA hydratase/carnithine racemase